MWIVETFRHLDIFFLLILEFWLRSTFNNSTLLEKRKILTMVLSYALCLNEKESKLYLWMRCQDCNSFPIPSKRFYWLSSCIYKMCEMTTIFMTVWVLMHTFAERVMLVFDWSLIIGFCFDGWLAICNSQCLNKCVIKICVKIKNSFFLLRRTALFYHNL